MTVLCQMSKRIQATYYLQVHYDNTNIQNLIQAKVKRQ